MNLFAWTSGELLIWMDSDRGHGLAPIGGFRPAPAATFLETTAQVLILVKAMKIELLYVKGCSRWKSALARLRQVLREERVSEPVRIIEVDHQEEAVRLRFLGSPTIRIDTYDIEPEASSRSHFGLVCRTYTDQHALY